MPTYLVETYVSRTGAGGVQDVAARVAATAELPGTRLLSAFFLPEDETCFLLYEAASAELLGQAARRARGAVAADAGGDHRAAAASRLKRPGRSLITQAFASKRRRPLSSSIA
jgi:hypothetical protein